MIDVINDELLEKVKEKGMTCLCTINSTPCFCDEFKEQGYGDCDCGVYTKKLVLYTTETCPKCKIVKKKLDDKSIPYVENMNVDEMLKLGVRSVPVLRVNNKLLQFKDANDYINKIQKELD